MRLALAGLLFVPAAVSASPPAESAAAALLGEQPLVLTAPHGQAPSPAPAATPPTAEVQAPLQPGEPELVLERSRRRLRVLEGGREVRSFPVAVGMPGWETPVGRFQVIEMAANPVWKHPARGTIHPPGPSNPLGSRWIGFHRDCRDRSGFNGQEHLQVKGCATAGFHGTNDRSSVGRAVSHGCVRLYDEHVIELFSLVRMGTPVTVLP
ncbi:MAG: L,D-transpeptidase [Cyanobium sp.]